MSTTRTHRGAIAAFLVSGALALAGLGAIAASPAAAGAGGAPQELRPDVIVRPIIEIHIEKSRGVKLLRFATIVGNRGAGPVELQPLTPDPDTDDCDGDGDPMNDRRAMQIVYGDSNGNGVFDRPMDEPVGPPHPVGCSVFHVAHNHWHLEEFARYLLVKPATGRVKATAEKVSFCVRDSISFASPVGSPALGFYGNCTQDSTTGLSIGWADYYASNLVGQELDIRGLPDGRYCLRTEADPADRLVESDDTNNGRSTLVRIRGRLATDLRLAC